MIHSTPTESHAYRFAWDFFSCLMGEAWNGAIEPSADADRCLGRPRPSLVVLTASCALGALICVRHAFNQLRESWRATYSGGLVEWFWCMIVCLPHCRATWSRTSAWRRCRPYHPCTHSVRLRAQSWADGRSSGPWFRYQLQPDGRLRLQCARPAEADRLVPACNVSDPCRASVAAYRSDGLLAA
jgi:hypothetical protein